MNNGARNPARIPPLPALRSFEAVARLGGFAKAAQELNVSTSAVSHQIRGMEDSLGVRLIDRTTGTGDARLTRAGDRLLQATQIALAQLAEACTDIAGPRRRRRSLVISANSSISALWLAPRLAGFAALHPEMELQSVLHHGAPDMARKGIDLALLHSRAAASPLGANDVPLLTETVVPVCSPDLLRAHPAIRDQAAALMRCQLLEEEHPDSPETEWRTWFSLLGAAPADPGQVMRLSNLSMVIGAAVAGSGIALGRAPLIEYELRSGRLVRLLPRLRIAGSWGYVMRTRPSPNPLVQALCSYLLGEARRSPRGGLSGG